MRKLIAISTVLILFSCGMKLAEPEDAPTVSSEASIDRNGLVFDPTGQLIPFPNDILWAETDGNVTLPVDEAEDNGTKLLYRAVNSLGIKGLSPNMFVAVPLVNDKLIDKDSLSSRYYLFDLTDFKSCVASGLSCSDINETEKLEFLQDGKFMKFYPLEPLDAGHQYLFVLLDGIKDKNGNTLFEPLIYKSLESTEPVDDPSLEILRQKYQYLYDTVLPGVGSLLSLPFDLNRESVLEMFTFTTADKTLSVKDFGIIKEALTNGTIAENLESFIEGLDYSNIVLEYKGLENSVFSSVGTVTNETFTTFNFSSQGLENVTYSIFNGDTYSGKVYIFMHGLGTDKTVAAALTSDVSYPVISFDLPYHGDRVMPVDNPYTLCNETVSGSCYLTENPGSDRLNFYQSIFDLRVITEALKDGKFDIDGDGSSDTPTEIDFVGMSLGSIVGAPFLSIDVDNGSVIDKAVLNVGGANLVSILDTAENSMIKGLVDVLGAEKNSLKYFVTLGLFQTLLDPADPAYLVENDLSNKTIVQTAYGDSIVPFVSNKALAKKVGFNSYNFTDFDNVQSTPTWYMFGNETNYVNHGFLLSVDNLDINYPEVYDLLGDSSYLESAQKAAREQINDFFSN